MVVVLCLIPVAYLVGTFPSAALVARTRGIDILSAGSGNPGASNTTRLLGWRLGLVVLLADIGKGAAAAGAGSALDGHRGAYILGVAAVLGHVFPVTRRFKGGRGVATAAGAVAVVFPLVILVLGVVWFVIARGLRRASIASLVCAVLFPTVVAVRGSSWGDIAVASGLGLLVIARHLSNLRRLIRGEEHRLGGSADGGGSVAA
ncbi:MAG TPA: glycerol-3-phosphate acyltransferase [Acidimicrobiia bacterium]|nr:glycerol-3-phosphate acyltransferase [Acidimicrobiia bacterium]